jgi:transcriptional regulator with XRE-family HTH domain
MNAQVTGQHDNAEVMGAAIRTRMAELALSQNDLYRRSGVSPYTITRLRRGDPGPYRADRLQKVSNALGWNSTHIEELLYGKTPAPQVVPPTVAQQIAELRDYLVVTTEQQRAILRRLDELEERLAGPDQAHPR